MIKLNILKQADDISNIRINANSGSFDMSVNNTTN